MDAVPNIVVRHAGCESAQQFRILAGVEDPPEGIRALTEEEIKDLAMRGQRGDQTGKDGGGNEPEPEAEPEPVSCGAVSPLVRRRSPKRQQTHTRPSSSGSGALDLCRVLQRGTPALVGRRSNFQILCPCAQPLAARNMEIAQIAPWYCVENIGQVDNFSRWAKLDARM